MARFVANVNQTTDNFAQWLDKTNTLLTAFSTEIVTANVATGWTTGNAQVNGFFSANTLIAGSALRGGNVTSNATLTITANLVANFTANVTGATAISNTLSVLGSSTLANTLAVTGAATLANTLAVTGDATLSSNVGIGIGASSAYKLLINNYSTGTTFALLSNTFVANATTDSLQSIEGLQTKVHSISQYANSTIANTSNIYGNRTFVYNGNTSSASNARANAMYAVSGDVYNYANGALANTVAWAYGGSFSFTQAATAGVTNTAYGVSSIVNNAGTSTAINTAFLFYGDYVGTTPANAYGIWISDENFNYLSGNTGIGNTTPNAKFQVTGTANISGATAFANLTIHTGNATFSNTIAVTGATTLANTLAVTGNATFSNTIAVTGNATFSNTISVTGLSSLSGGLNTTTANASVAVNIGSNVNISLTQISVGNSTSNSSITQSAITTSGTIAATGAATLSNTITVTGNAIFSNTISVTGNATFSNTIAVTGNVTLSNTSAHTGAATFANTISVTGAATFSNTVNVTGLTTLNNLTVSSLTVTGYTIATNSASTSSTTQTIVDSFPKTDANFAKYFVGIKNASGSLVHTIELMAIHDGTTVSLSKYGEVFNTAALGTFDAVINNANAELKFTAGNTTVYTIKTTRMQM